MAHPLHSGKLDFFKKYKHARNTCFGLNEEVIYEQQKLQPRYDPLKKARERFSPENFMQIPKLENGPF